MVDSAAPVSLFFEEESRASRSTISCVGSVTLTTTTRHSICNHKGRMAHKIFKHIPRIFLELLIILSIHFE